MNNVTDINKVIENNSLSSYSLSIANIHVTPDDMTEYDKVQQEITQLESLIRVKTHTLRLLVAASIKSSEYEFHLGEIIHNNFDNESYVYINGEIIPVEHR